MIECNPVHSIKAMDPWCETHGRSVILCIKEMNLQISEMLSKVEKFKCSERARDCTARHIGYNLAIDDVLEVLRSPEKRVVPVPECGKQIFYGDIEHWCQRDQGHDGECSKLRG